MFAWTKLLIACEFEDGLSLEIDVYRCDAHAYLDLSVDAAWVTTAVAEPRSEGEGLNASK